MKLTNNSTPKPENFIWKVSLTGKENDRLISTLAAFSGVKLRHGKYIVSVKRGAIEKVDSVLSTVVEVEGVEYEKSCDKQGKFNAKTKMMCEKHEEQPKDE